MKRNKVFLITFKKIIKRITAANGVSKQSITRKKKNSKGVTEGYFAIPKKYPVQPKLGSGILYFDVYIIR